MRKVALHNQVSFDNPKQRAPQAPTNIYKSISRREGIKKLSTSKYAVSLYELIKAYAEIKRKQNFSIMNISKLPVYTMEEAIKKITSLLKDLTEWRDIKDLVPGSFSGSRNLKKSGLAGTFAGSLELVREGKLSIMQKKIFDKILIKSR